MAEEKENKASESGRRFLSSSRDLVAESGGQLVIKNKELSELIQSKFAELGNLGPHPGAIDVDVTVRG